MLWQLAIIALIHDLVPGHCIGEYTSHLHQFLYLIYDNLISLEITINIPSDGDYELFWNVLICMVIQLSMYYVIRMEFYAQL